MGGSSLDREPKENVVFLLIKLSIVWKLDVKWGWSSWTEKQQRDICQRQEAVVWKLSSKVTIGKGQLKERKRGKYLTSVSEEIGKLGESG